MDLKLSFVILNWASESPVSRHIYQGGFPGVFWAFLLIEWKFFRDQECLTGQRACCVWYKYNRDEIYKLKCIFCMLYPVWNALTSAELREGDKQRTDMQSYLCQCSLSAGLGLVFPFPAFFGMCIPQAQSWSRVPEQWLNKRGIHFPCVEGWKGKEGRRKWEDEQ